VTFVTDKFHVLKIPYLITSVVDVNQVFPALCW